MKFHLVIFNMRLYPTRKYNRTFINTFNSPNYTTNKYLKKKYQQNHNFFLMSFIQERAQQVMLTPIRAKPNCCLISHSYKN